ncbi:LysR family transcriptional regulator [Frigidibacter sp. RF13]|uniref:LysR family transcriptional regulator n=1 Tax=Frigidibacter sp. RF13 TaxID=2997340 RepID=UPI00226EA25A|nr:LysR family transcriptional regulator [Frigidibacter sp. RF13]MCY1126446.1 LysR family transcriptional regulator [Frigidibacter sp. RF13]
MNNRHTDLPPLEWVRAFEAAARLGSFTLAASELGLTQAAVSQRIGHLEARLGAALFLRQARRIILTVEGEAWLPFVTEALRSLQQSTDDLFSTGRRRIAISASTSISELWLVPRLAGLAAADRPDLSIRTMVLNIDPGPPEPQVVRIRYGVGGWAESYRAPLYAEALAPVAAPQLLSGRDWRDLPRIGLTGPRAGWKEWCAASGGPATPQPTLRFDSFAVAAAAARAGLGVLVGSLPLLTRDLADGSLVRLSSETLRPRETYWLLAGTDTVSRRQWDRLTALFCDVSRPSDP